MERQLHYSVLALQTHQRMRRGQEGLIDDFSSLSSLCHRLLCFAVSGLSSYHYRGTASLAASPPIGLGQR